MLAVAAVRGQHHPQRAEGGGVREEGTWLLRSRAGRPAHTHQDRVLRNLAEPRRQADLQHLPHVRRRHLSYQTTARNYVRCKW